MTIDPKETAAPRTDQVRAALSWTSPSRKLDAGILGPPAPSGEPVADSTPAIAAGGTAEADERASDPAPAEVPAASDDAAPVEETQALAEAPAVTEVEAEPVPADTPDAAEEPPASEPPAGTEVASRDPSGIARRVRDVVLSPGATDAASSAPAAADPPAQTSDVALSEDAWWDVLPSETTAAEPPLPEIVPHPAPASQRPRQPVVVVTAERVEPVAVIRPDNAIFFENWSLVPPLPIGRGPGY
jgi:hypothetical protein